MDEGPENPLLVSPRRLDAEVDRIIEDPADVEVRLTAVEVAVSGLHRCRGRLDVRTERIERRLDLVDMPH